MSILFAFPQYAGWCIASHMQSVARMAAELSAIGFDYDMTFGQDSAVHRNRYFLTDSFMRSRFEYMFFIDADIEFTTAQVLDLHQTVNGGAADVAVGCYKLKQDGAMLAAHHGGKLVALTDLPDQPFEVDYAGTGFMLINRRAFELIRPDLPTIDTIKGLMPRWWGFDVVDGVELPEDYSFCERVRAKGGKIVMHPDVILPHWGLKAW